MLKRKIRDIYVVSIFNGKHVPLKILKEKKKYPEEHI
jgi:hypothetical protein